MAGSLYIGSNKICPARVVGSGESVLPMYDLVDGSVVLKEHIDGSGIITIGTHSFSGDNGYYNKVFFTNPGIVSVDFPDLTTIEEEAITNLFSRCGSLKTISMPKVTSIGNNGVLNMIYGSQNVETVDLSSLRNAGDESLKNAFCNSGILTFPVENLITIGDNGADGMCSQCTRLTNASFNELQTVGEFGFDGCFYGCSSLDTVIFRKLSYIGYRGLGYCFSGSSVKNVYFYGLSSNSFYDNDVFRYMLEDVNGCTVHFPSNLQSVIGNWSWVVSGFGGTNTSVLFDLS